MPGHAGSTRYSWQHGLLVERLSPQLFDSVNGPDPRDSNSSARCSIEGSG